MNKLINEKNSEEIEINNSSIMVNSDNSEDSFIVITEEEAKKIAVDLHNSLGDKSPLRMKEDKPNGLIASYAWRKLSEHKPICYLTGDWDGQMSDMILVKTENDAIHLAKAYLEDGVYGGYYFYSYYVELDIDGVIEWATMDNF